MGEHFVAHAPAIELFARMTHQKMPHELERILEAALAAKVAKKRIFVDLKAGLRLLNVLHVHHGASQCAHLVIIYSLRFNFASEVPFQGMLAGEEFEAVLASYLRLPLEELVKVVKSFFRLFRVFRQKWNVYKRRIHGQVRIGR